MMIPAIQKETKQNVHIVLFGDSYRIKGKGHALPGSYEGQMKAFKSHVDFIKQIEEKKDIKCSISIYTLSTAFDKDTSSFWEGTGIPVITSDFATKYPGTRDNSLCINARKALMPPNADQFDYAFFLRIDLILKPIFAQVITFDPERILFPCSCFINWPGHGRGWHKMPDGTPRVQGVMAIVPQKWYRQMHSVMNTFGHDTWSNLARAHKMGKDNMGFFLQTYHDADSLKDWNPLYYMWDRPGDPTWNSINFEINHDTLEPEEVPENIFRERYSHYDYPSWTK